MALLEQPPSPGTRTAALDRIRAALPDLSPAERRVAERVLADPARAIALSIGEFAEVCEVAQPTVSRFCRSVGFPGYAALRLGVANDFAAESHGAREAPADPLGALADRLRTDASLPAVAHAARVATRVEIWPAAELAGAAGVLAAGLAELSVPAAVSAVPAHWPARARGLPPDALVLLLAYGSADFGQGPGIEAATAAGARVAYAAAQPSRSLLKRADLSAPLPEHTSPELVGQLFAEALVEAVRLASHLAGPPGPVSPWRQWPHVRTVFLPRGGGEDPIPCMRIDAPHEARRECLVIFYNGFTANKEQAVPPGTASNRVSPNVVAALLNAGYDVLVPDAPGHGDRKRAWEDAVALHQDSLAGKGPDLLAQAREEATALVDGALGLGIVSGADRIAVVGQSWGGLQALLKLAGDRRISCGAAIMPVCDVTQLPQFADLGAAPRVRESGPGPQLAELLAPRPLLLIAGERDPLTTPEHIADFAAAISPAYATATDHLRHVVLDGVAHEFDPRQVDEVLVWLARHVPARRT
ncbi:alpha/beta fold hydrolase [Actinacidiphila guanduensis]|uniref:Transcriptional regulator, RpiR family n=1 Tax=Actinacidiphila guanduensis TaxID=310781 RepID=A0A1H0QJT4_9ACTN|nr:alpha/beta fold hydrolase [Actinacidiphila guanduensis]SDP17653.1 transcriptional regulator, RpiR family [Actinacidiphila guanduensis]